MFQQDLRNKATPIPTFYPLDIKFLVFTAQKYKS